MGMYPLSLLESRVAAQGMELCIDSRKATPGCVFVALPGSSADGSQFIAVLRPRGTAAKRKPSIVPIPVRPLGCWPAPGTGRLPSRSPWSA